MVSLLVLAASLAGCQGDRPSFAGEAASAKAAAHSHATSDETCFICDPSKRDPGRLWCKEHGRYEDRCWECHPDLRDSKRPYCDEHGLYEDECVLCDPSRAEAPRRSESVDPAEGKKTELFCAEHQVPEEECGVCHPERSKTLPVGGAMLVRLPSERSAEVAGLTVARPGRADANTSIALLGELRFDGNRLAEVTALSGGIVAEIHADVGQEVEAGEVLAVLHSPGVAEARAEYLAARADLYMKEAAWKRQRRLVEGKIGSREEMEEAEAFYRRAQVATKLGRQRLSNLGFTEAELGSVKDARSELPMRAPFHGTVVKRDAVRGEAVDGGAALFQIVDRGQMWVEISVPEEQATKVRVETPIQVGVRGVADGTVTGRITWVSPVVDRRTRMVRARGVVPNHEGELRDGMFADVKAILHEHPDSLLLPTSAVHRIDDLPFVFVQKAPDLFAARRVEIGDRLATGELVVHRGLEADEAVVTSGGFAIKSALLASRLGAGCTDE